VANDSVNEYAGRGLTPARSIYARVCLQPSPLREVGNTGPDRRSSS
jgi:hypothetical protein